MPNYVDTYSVEALRNCYEGRINDLKNTLDLITEQRDFFQRELLRRVGIVSERETNTEVRPIQINRSRETPGQVAARLQSEANRRYWENERKKAEANGELSAVSHTEG